MSVLRLATSQWWYLECSIIPVNIADICEQISYDMSDVSISAQPVQGCKTDSIVPVNHVVISLLNIPCLHISLNLRTEMLLVVLLSIIKCAFDNEP